MDRHSAQTSPAAQWPRSSLLGLLVATCALWMAPAQAYLLDDDADAAQWQEDAVPPAPAFSADNTVSFEVSRHSELHHGIDPSTLSVGQDGVVRYVRVATSPSGALNATYEGVRCSSAEVRSYAYWTASEKSWRENPHALWLPLNQGAATLAAKVLAYTALCDGRTPNGTPKQILLDLKYGKRR